MFQGLILNDALDCLARFASNMCVYAWSIYLYAYVCVHVAMLQFDSLGRHHRYHSLFSPVIIVMHICLFVSVSFCVCLIVSDYCSVVLFFFFSLLPCRGDSVCCRCFFSFFFFVCQHTYQVW